MEHVNNFTRKLEKMVEDYTLALVSAPAKNMEEYNKRIGIINGINMSLVAFQEFIAPKDLDDPNFSSGEY